MPKTTCKATLYLRISDSDERAGESNSIANQRKLLQDFADKHPDIEVVSEKVDDGFSGVLFDRPAFQEMLRDIEAGKTDCVIVKDLSRMGRDYIETGHYLRRVFPAWGVRFIAVNDNIDTINENAGDNLIVSVKNIINDTYSRDISTKIRSALSIKRTQGDYVGACPTYGYKKAEDNKNQLVIDEYPASVVREIYRLKIDGMSASRIAEELNSHGVLSPLNYKKDRELPYTSNGFADSPDAKWVPNTVIRILQDETYTGALIQGRRGTPNYKVKEIVNRPREEWARKENAHEAIIPKGDFELVRRLMSLDTRTTPDGKNVYLFSGILICGCCGARMTRKTNRYKNEVYNYYYCPTGKKNGCAKAVMVKESDLTTLVLANLKAHIRCVFSLDEQLARARTELAGSALAKRLETQVADTEQKLARMTSFRAGLFELMTSGNLSKEDYRALKNSYTEEISEAQRTIGALKTELADLLSGNSERLRWMERLQQFEHLTELDRRTVSYLVQYIKVISKNEITIQFTFQDEYEKAALLLERGAA